MASVTGSKLRVRWTRDQLRPFLADSDEPRFDDTDALRRLARRAALAYRCSAHTTGRNRRQPHLRPRSRADRHFWLLRYGVPFGATVSLVLVGGGAIVDTSGNADPTINISFHPLADPRPGPRSSVRPHAHAMRRGRRTPTVPAIVQEATAFFSALRLRRPGRQRAVTDGGKRITVALGEGHGVILHHGH
jgi:hypothetical protein